MKSSPLSISCTNCSLRFPSKNQLFRHLSSPATTCLTSSEYTAYLTQVASAKRYWEKIAVLYGYLPGTDWRFQTGSCGDHPTGVEDGQHAAWLVCQAIDLVTHGPNYKVSSEYSPSKINRSYGISTRATDVAEQDANTGAITEVLCTMTTPLDSSGVDGETIGDDRVGATADSRQRSKEWVEKVNRELGRILERMQVSHHSTCRKKVDCRWMAGDIRVFGRVTISNKKFNAESDSVHRRVDYCFPADLLFSIHENGREDPSDVSTGEFNTEINGASASGSAIEIGKNISLQQQLDSLHSFPPVNKSYRVIDVSKHDNITEEGSSPADLFFRNDSSPSFTRPSESTLRYFLRLKRLMRNFQTQVEVINELNESALLEKSLNEIKRKNQKAPKNRKARSNANDKCQRVTEDVDRTADPCTHNDSISDNNTLEEATIKCAESKSNPDKLSVSETATVKRYLRRKRYHNFSPNILAHDYWAYRRVDRFYHRGTIRLDGAGSSTSISSDPIQKRPFFVFSMKGDVFLHQQVLRVMGLVIAICRGVIDESILECIFDEEYNNLVPAPPAPSIGLLAGEVSYITWEGRLKLILRATQCDRFPNGWNDDDIIRSVEAWETTSVEQIAMGWYWDGFTKDGRLKSEVDWIENVLHPWAVRTKPILQDYHRWKSSKISFDSLSEKVASSTVLPSLVSINANVPILYEKVLHYLRLANESELWPSTTPKRHLVMVTTSKDEAQVKSLSVAHIATKTVRDTRSSAYSFHEGQGGASGSFSVGVMPDGGCSQPKGNIIFPELVRAAFELEIALKPDRPPSSTIAINRNAQFRPHTDNGAGAGQSTSLIVGLGNYFGGELMVEGEKNDIRYNPIEFDGWKERHWVLPFSGERYSLVWFTPQGCDDKRGIDLELGIMEE